MNRSASGVRRFDTATAERTLGDQTIGIVPGVEASEGGRLSAYSAVFGRGERASLPAAYDEIWVVVRGRLRVSGPSDDLIAEAGDYLHVPEDSPGEVEALETTTLVCVSVPAH